jgi:phage FluMu gp28-like protein
VKEFGEWNPGSHRTGKIELCQFTTQLKGELFPRLRSALERKELLIPASREIREDLHSIQRVVSTNGQITYRSSQSGDGHSDRCTALALALRAASSLVSTAKAESIHVRGRPPVSQWARDLIMRPYRT